jgi:hypothetical protein
MPQQGYGAQQPYGGPQPYGQPPPYGYGGYPQQGYVPVQQFHGAGYRAPSSWGGGFWSTYWMIRLIIAGIVISLSLVGACVSALSH